MRATSVDDRRGSRRADAQLDVELEAAALGAQELFARTRNVSANGVYCVLDREIPLFTKLQMALEIPIANDDGPPMRIACTGVVVRHEEVQRPDGLAEHTIAVFFERIAPRAKQALEVFVDQSWAGR